MEDRKGQRDLLPHFNIDDTGVTVFQSKILKSEEWNFHTLRIFTLENDREASDDKVTRRSTDHHNSIILWQEWMWKSSRLNAVLGPHFVKTERW